MKNESKIDFSVLFNTIEKECRNNSNNYYHNSAEMNLVKYRKRRNLDLSIKKSLNNHNKESDLILPLLTVDCHKISDAKKLNNEFKKIVSSDIQKENYSGKKDKIIENKDKAKEDIHIRNILHKVNLSLDMKKENFIEENIKILRRYMINIHEILEKKCKRNFDYLFSNREVIKDYNLPNFFKRKEEKELLYSTSNDQQKLKSTHYLGKFVVIDNFLENILIKIKRRAVFLSETHQIIKEDEIVNLLKDEVNQIKDNLKKYLISDSISKNLTKEDKKLISVKVINLIESFIIQTNSNLFTNEEILKHTQPNSYGYVDNQEGNTNNEKIYNLFDPSIIKIYRKNKIHEKQEKENQSIDKETDKGKSKGKRNEKSRNRLLTGKNISNTESNENICENHYTKDEKEFKNDEKILSKKLNSKKISQEGKDFRIKNTGNLKKKTLNENHTSQSIEELQTLDKNSTIDRSYSRNNYKNEENIKELDKKLSSLDLVDETIKKSNVLDNINLTSKINDSNTNNKFKEYKILFSQNSNETIDNRKINHLDRNIKQKLIDYKHQQLKEDKYTRTLSDKESTIHGKRLRKRSSTFINKKQLFKNLNIVFNNQLEDFITENNTPLIGRSYSTKELKKKQFKYIILNKGELEEKIIDHLEIDDEKKIRLNQYYYQEESKYITDTKLNNKDQNTNKLDNVNNNTSINGKNQVYKKDEFNNKNYNIKENRLPEKQGAKLKEKVFEKNKPSGKQDLKVNLFKKDNDLQIKEEKNVTDKTKKKIEQKGKEKEKEKEKLKEKSKVKEKVNVIGMLLKKENGNSNQIINTITIKKKSEKSLKLIEKDTVKNKEENNIQIESENDLDSEENLENVNTNNKELMNKIDDENKNLKEDVEENEEDDDNDDETGSDINKLYKNLHNGKLNGKKKKILRMIKTKILQTPDYFNDDDIENYILSEENDEKDNAEMMLRKLDLKNRLVSHKLRRNSRVNLELPIINPKDFFNKNYNKSKKLNNKKRDNSEDQDEPYYRKNYNNSIDFIRRLDKGKFVNGIAPFINNNTFLNDEK